MSFPVYFHIGSAQIHPHLLMEGVAYLAGLILYFINWGKAQVGLDPHERLWIGASALVGAALGSKILFWFCDPVLSLAHWNDPFYLIGGKTVVGGLIGGWLAVEFAKKRLGVTLSTGDRFVPSILLGTAIGRVGCFLTGLPDNTYGNATALPWGVDFGDGIPRHPTQLYEIAWLSLLGFLLWRFSKRHHRPGDLFKLYMVGYLGFRLVIEFIKPGVFLAGLTAIQWACLFALAYYARYFLLLSRFKEVVEYDG